MKSNLTSINKMIKNFDKELKELLTTELKINKANSKKVNTLSFISQNKLRFA